MRSPSTSLGAIVPVPGGHVNDPWRHQQQRRASESPCRPQTEAMIVHGMSRTRSTAFMVHMASRERPGMPDPRQVTGNRQAVLIAAQR
jgi:hypothetical protein